MGFPFAYVCDLFSELEASSSSSSAAPHYRAHAHRRKPARNEYERKAEAAAVISRWFDVHRSTIHSSSSSSERPAVDHLALLSCLLPDHRPDRVLGFGVNALVKIIGRCLLLGPSRIQALNGYQTPDGGDLGRCVENVMRQTEDGTKTQQSPVSVEQIHAALDQIASRCRFSSSDIRNSAGNFDSASTLDGILSPIFRALPSGNAKWLTRLILRERIPELVPDALVIKEFHLLLPTILQVRSSLAAALELLGSDPFNIVPSRPDFRSAKALRQLCIPYLSPCVGVKVGRIKFLKSRSIDHCCNMADKRVMSVERKYDGEYCQIHVDLSKPRGEDITIYSKSGKESTRDRKKIHGVIRDTLRVGSPDCKIAKRCILEGEMLVWSDEDNSLLPFHKIRNHVARSGVYIGTRNDSQPKSFEHLFVVFFDILLVDDTECLSRRLTDRKALLASHLYPIPGWSSLAENRVLDFSDPDAPEQLRRYFALAVSKRWEGFVLKCLYDNYMPVAQPDKASYASYAGCWIKLKKDYIPGLGDTADFAIVGATYLPTSVPPPQKSPRRMVWTTFFIGCRESDGGDDESRPTFRIVDTVDFNNMPLDILEHLNEYGQFMACDDIELSPFRYNSDQPQLPPISTVFKTPFVAEMYGAGFEIPGDVNYRVLRFPRLVKIHQDRSWRDAISFDELQRIAAEAMTVPEDTQFEKELRCWRDKLGCRADSYCETTEDSLDDHDDEFDRCASSTPETELFDISQPPIRRRSALVGQTPEQADPLRLFPPRLFCFPVLLSSSLLGNRSSSLALFARKAESMTNSIPEFLAAVLQAHFDAGVCKGIVLVNPDRQHSLQTTSDIIEVGNAIYTSMERSRCGARYDTTPGAGVGADVGGMIFFLNWLVLAQKDEHRRDLDDAWRKKVFVGCLKWGALADQPQRPSKRRRISDGSDADQSSSSSPVDAMDRELLDASSVSFNFDDWEQINTLF